jgi:pimeloyl-ACP methyl ester carboxylesterase
MGSFIRNIDLALFLLLSFSAFSLSADETGFKEYAVYADDTSIEVFAYHPPGCKKSDILVVFHGLKRKASSLRKKAIPIAKQACLTVFAPRFDKQRFPNWRYHRAGVSRSGKIQPRERWTGPILQALLKQLRNIAGDPSSRLYLFGHSAGGQFLSRVSAYSPPSSVDRIVVANPSLHVVPAIETLAPVGFAGLFSELESRQRIKAYLELPITIYLGQNDTGEKYLVKSKQAMQQGRTRLERGRYVFHRAEKLAREKGWNFNWKLVEVPGVGHSSKGMLQAQELLVALGLTESLKTENSNVKIPMRH